MNCEQVKQMLVNYLDNGVNDEERASIEAHLGHCPDCMTEMEALVATQNGFRQIMRESIADIVAPAHALAMIKQSIAQEQRRKMPLVHSLKSKITHWWKGLRARPVWQQALAFLPIAAIIIGSSAGIAYSRTPTINFNMNHFDIFVMDADGSNKTALTNNNVMEHGTWFDNGTKIVFRSGSTEASGNSEICIMDADGTNITQITDSDTSEYGVRISPDGTRIAFISNGNISNDFYSDLYSDIYLMNIDGSNRTQITDFTDKRVLQLAWSPDGSKIAFVANEWEIKTTETDSSAAQTPEEIYVVDADGSNLTRLTNDTHNDVNPVWSPDSRRIVFSSFYDSLFNSHWKICITDANGSNFATIASIGKCGDYSSLAWSPNGSKIAFTKENGKKARNGRPKNDIYTMNVDGSDQTRLTDNNSVNESLTWSPDGTKIAYVAEPVFVGFLSGTEIYVVNADGSNPIRLTDNTAADIGPCWSPDGSKILYSSGANHIDQQSEMIQDGNTVEYEVTR